MGDQENNLKNLYHAAAQVQLHEAEATKLFAERQAVVDAALEQWERANQEKVVALKQHQQALEGWTRTYKTLQSDFQLRSQTEPGIPAHIGIQRGEAQVFIHESGLQRFLDEPRNVDAMSLFMVVDRQRLIEFANCFGHWTEDRKHFVIPDWIANRYPFLDVRYPLIFNRSILAALHMPEPEYEPEEGAHPVVNPENG